MYSLMVSSPLAYYINYFMCTFATYQNRMNVHETRLDCNIVRFSSCLNHVVVLHGHCSSY